MFEGKGFWDLEKEKLQAPVEEMMTDGNVFLKVPPAAVLTFSSPDWTGVYSYLLLHP